MSVETKLPEGWVECQLGNIVEYGKTQKTTLSEVSDDVWVLELEDIEKETSKLIQVLTAAERPFKSTKNCFKKGDVLYGKLRPYLNKVLIPEDSGICTTEIIPLDAEPNISNRYLFFWLKSHAFLAYVNEVSYGVNMPRLGTKDGQAAPFILPPLAEQQVIADQLDSLLAQVEATKTRLERIPDTLKRFRQSVLADAVSGKLTEGWREKVGNKWEILTIDELAEVKGGKRLPKGDELTETNTGYPYIRAGQLKNGTVIKTQDSRSKQLYLNKESHEKISRYTVNTGDLYLTIVGASIGDAGVIPSNYDGANLTENAAKITKFKRPVSSVFISYWLRSRELQDLIQLEIKSGAQGKLALKRIKDLPVPYTDIKEQAEIVRRVEQLFAYADRVEQQASAALAQVSQLTQSILAKAFRGELTAKWRAANPELVSGDNSAGALLARIKEERAAVVRSGRKIKAEV
jgi:type I restriction enzyme, S subunit